MLVHTKHRLKEIKTQMELKQYLPIAEVKRTEVEEDHLHMKKKKW